MSSYNTSRNVISASEYNAVSGKDAKDLSGLGEEQKKPTKKNIGTIFMGPESNREMSIDDILGQSTHALWNKNTEEEYMTRLKEKAVLKVKSLLAKAEEKSEERLKEAEKEVEEVYKRAQAKEEEAKKLLEDAQQIKLEAENIKDEAKQEGYNMGLHQAQAQLEEAREALVQEKSQQVKACSHVLLNIHEQCITIFESWRKDLTELLLEAVETSTAYVLDQDKSAMLQSLLMQSVNALLDKREYKVRVNPQESMVLTELMEEVNKSFNVNSRWSLESDDSLESGSIIVESPSGLIRNERSEREKLVKEVLEKLTLPLGAGDQAAYDAITRNLVGQARETKIPLSPEEEESYTQEHRQNLLSQPDLIEKEQMAQEAEADTSAQMQGVQNEPDKTDKAVETVGAADQSMHEVQEVQQMQEVQGTEETHESQEEQKEQEKQEGEKIEHKQENFSTASDATLNPEEDTISQQANKMVEEELSQLNEDLVQEDKEVKQAASEQEKKNQEKSEYTTELADELLNEMGFN